VELGVQAPDQTGEQTDDVEPDGRDHRRDGDRGPDRRVLLAELAAAHQHEDRDEEGGAEGQGEDAHRRGFRLRDVELPQIAEIELWIHGAVLSFAELPHRAARSSRREGSRAA
jgi:hypothetical protein